MGTLVYDLPEDHDYVTFRSLCGYDSSCDTDNTGASDTTMEFIVKVDGEQGYDVDLAGLGYRADQPIALYDCWAKTPLETVTNSLHVDVPSNGAKLYRLKPEPSADGRLNATTTKVGKADYDSQSYVQIIFDGKPAGSLKYDGEPDLPSQGWRAHHCKG